MTIDYIVSSLPQLVFDQPPQLTASKFAEICGEAITQKLNSFKKEKWSDIETQIKNAIAAQRGGGKYLRPVQGCSVYWRNKIVQCFQEKNIAKRQEMLDKVYWEASEELTDVASPLGLGALATYSIKLEIAIKRALISTSAGNAAFERLTAETRITF